MSHLSQPTDVHFFVSCLFNEVELDLAQAQKKVEDLIGSSLIFQPSFNPLTEYYAKEMGQNLKRVIFYQKEKKSRSGLVDLKIKATLIEEENSVDSKRFINIDPGFVAQEQLVLATGKPYSHRVYLERGVYAELTYTYQQKSFHSLPWTYPDYQHPEKIEFFNSLR